MLVLTRRPGELIIIEPDTLLDPNSSVRNLFGEGPIEITVSRIIGSRVKLAIHAHPRLRILRSELHLRDRNATIRNYKTQRF